MGCFIRVVVTRRFRQIAASFGSFLPNLRNRSTDDYLILEPESCLSLAFSITVGFVFLALVHLT